jgi:hypothetical protein
MSKALSADSRSRPAATWLGAAAFPGTAAQGSPEDVAAQTNPLAPYACQHTYQSTGYVQAHSHAEPPGRFRLYAVGCAVDPNFVELRPLAVTWLQDGARASLKLRQPPAAPEMNAGPAGVTACAGHAVP